MSYTGGLCRQRSQLGRTQLYLFCSYYGKIRVRGRWIEMGYYLPITDYGAEQYRRRVTRNKTSPYHIERSYKIVFHGITRDERSYCEMVYERAKRKKPDKNREKERKRFSRQIEFEEGKGEIVNVQ